MSRIRFPLETERLVIRPLRIEDAEALHELYSDAEAMRFLTDSPPRSLDESRAWVQEKIDLFERDEGLSLWAVLERESGTVVGDAGVQWEPINGRRELDLACRLVPRFHGRGYGSEASLACLRAAWDDLGATRVTAETDEQNVRARALLERLGADYEGRAFWGRRAMAVYAWNRARMDVADVHEVLDALVGLRVWLDGGWGVDALVGAQTREHSDLDLAVDTADLPAAEEALARIGFAEVHADPGRPARVVLRDGRGRQIDLHPLAFDERGDGWQELPDGKRGLYPGAELVGGVVAGRSVPCISAELQRRHHSGYVLSERDRADLATLSRVRPC